MHISEIVRWIFAVVIGLFGWLLVSANFGIVYNWLAHKKRGSMIFPIGGFFAFAGMGLCPLRTIHRFAWLPIALDMGFYFSILIIGLFMHLFAARVKKRKNNA